MNKKVIKEKYKSTKNQVTYKEMKFVEWNCFCVGI